MPSVFVTVGSTSFPALTDFITSADALRELHALSVTQLTVQHGTHAARLPSPSSGEVEATQPAVSTFAYAPSLREHLRAASAVVSHAGAGTVLETIDLGKPLVVVVNSALMNDHQSELARAMSARNCCRVVAHSNIESALVPALRDALEGRAEGGGSARPPQRVPRVMAALFAQEVADAEGEGELRQR